MEFHFVTVGRNNISTITDPSKTPRAICFKSRVHAVKYVDYLSNYRSKFGEWPKIDLSVPMIKIEMDADFKKRTPEYVRKFIRITTKDYDELETTAMRCGLSYFYCHEFDYNEDTLLTLKMRGQEMNADIDNDMYKTWLELNVI